MITNSIILVENYGVDLGKNYWVIKEAKGFSDVCSSDLFSRKYTKRATGGCPVALFYALM